MNDLKEFAENVLGRLHEKACNEFHVSITERMKNNGAGLTGISAVPFGKNGGPCVYLDSYYKGYKDGGIQLPEIADEVYSQILRHKNDLMDAGITDFPDWDICRGHIYIKLVNAGRNKEMLKMAPHRAFLDLAAIYYLLAGSMPAEEGIRTAVVHNQHMLLWGQDEEKLYQAAMHNMRSDGTPVFENIWDTISSLAQARTGIAGSTETQTDTGMYVLTNHRKHYGASEILDKKTLTEISEKMGGDFTVLPSSVNETIVLAKNSSMEYRQMSSIVQEINTAFVSTEEFLSDHVYAYDRKDGALKIAA